MTAHGLYLSSITHISVILQNVLFYNRRVFHQQVYYYGEQLGEIKCQAKS